MDKRIKLRTLLIGGLVTLFFLVIIGKVFWLQIVQGSFWEAYGKDNYWSRDQKIPAVRGEITDRNGDALAINAPAYTVALQPKVILKNGLEDEVVQGLSKLLNKPESEIKALLHSKNKNGENFDQVEVRNEGWKIDQELKGKVEALSDQIQKNHKPKVSSSGITFIEDQKRYYPKETLAAHILGYTNREGAAITGLEKKYDDLLHGIDGSIKYESDRKGVKLTKAEEKYLPPKDGSNIKLTIDDNIQLFIEDAMKEAFAKLKPISMTVIAADPNTMEILGMANVPTFNPNEYWKEDYKDNFRNHALASTYEPGSTFKIVTLAGAVQEGLFNPNATYMSGRIKIPGYRTPLYDVKRDGWGQLTYLQGVKHSSNVAFVKLGYEMLGKERLLNYIKNFGFGSKTGIELSGEAKGVVHPQRDIEYATTTYGHGITVTPIQQVAAVAAVANGGKLLEPHIIKEINPPSGAPQITQPKVVRQVISPEKAKEVGSYLEQVVSDKKIGTGKNAYIPGYRVAGKTGTAVKPKTNGQAGYDYTKQVISFIGYAPVNDPKILVLVVIDEPQDSELSGGAAAAPVFKKIVSQSLEYMGVPKSNTAADEHSETMTAAPDLKGLQLRDAKSSLTKKGISFETLGKGSKIISQYPKAGTMMSSAQRVFLLTEESKSMQIPDLTGVSLRDAMEILTLMQVSVTVNGEGYVSSQKVTKTGGKRSVLLTLQPPSAPVKDASGGTANPSDKKSKEDSG
ncbi:penicillin-binding transpeptidase domain-containing protein [Paenibacillus sp. YPG26]|uniref:penicillin-binding transpeptidase domain-containing protein n=1 Tax=Paenibacillus sp. YPG26 TaxID=2878915 RepID=UPI00203A783D|nr:penicillin-binding transpeptidase domain-containing protein [Paenibacillus sp. YPG26]USB34497.1 PASTA domain-containing protein [Paenibacillus sp. YPG26]